VLLGLAAFLAARAVGARFGLFPALGFFAVVLGCHATTAAALALVAAALVGPALAHPLARRPPAHLLQDLLPDRELLVRLETSPTVLVTNFKREGLEDVPAADRGDGQRLMEVERCQSLDASGAGGGGRSALGITARTSPVAALPTGSKKP
jgi:hypothetical protein